jgi:hypothetical protein
MNETDRKPGNKIDYPSKESNKFTYQDVSTFHYREFMNTSKSKRNNNSEMRQPTKAIIIQAFNGTDRVNGAKKWRGNGTIHI